MHFTHLCIQDIVALTFGYCACNVIRFDVNTLQFILILVSDSIRLDNFARRTEL